MEELKEKLYDLINHSGLTPEMAYYVVKDFFRDMDAMYQEYLVKRKEAAAEAAAQEKKEDSDGQDN